MTVNTNHYNRPVYTRVSIRESYRENVLECCTGYSLTPYCFPQEVSVSCCTSKDNEKMVLHAYTLLHQMFSSLETRFCCLSVSYTSSFVLLCFAGKLSTQPWAHRLWVTFIVWKADSVTHKPHLLYQKKQKKKTTEMDNYSAAKHSYCMWPLFFCDSWSSVCVCSNGESY